MNRKTRRMLPALPLLFLFAVAPATALFDGAHARLSAATSPRADRGFSIDPDGMA